jgi:Concanavalin A-like lectin/glucanases superfamily/Secretion system C-terminal sorting domain
MKKSTILAILFTLFFFQAQAQYNALSFDGSNDFIDCGNPAAFQSNSITIEAWIKANPASGYRAIVTKQWAYGLYLSNNILISHLYNVGDLSTGVNVADGIWHHVAVTLSAGTVTVYLDGVAKASQSGYSIVNQNSNVLIGEGGPGAGQYFNGSIDEVRIWNVARTQAQIQASMNSAISSGTGLVAAYHFNQGTANGSNSSVTTLTDASGNNNNGTLNNFSLSGTNSNWVSGPSVLPVELSSFQAIVQEKAVQLKWRTSSETNNQGFEVLHSSDAIQWRALGFVEGYGTTSEGRAYNFQHFNPGSTGNYYRLRQVDFDGNFELSKVVFVALEGARIRPRISPTLTDGLVKIENYGKELPQISVFSSNGQLLMAAKASSQMDLSALRTGMYLVQVKSEKGLVTERIMKQ